VLLHVWVEPAAVSALESHLDHWHNVLVQNLVEVYVLSRLSFEDIGGLWKAQNVAFLALAVVLVVLLDRIVCQVHEGLVDGLLADGEWVRTHSYVAFLEEVALRVLEVDHVAKHPEPYVELPLVNQERPLDVLLEDEDLGLDVGRQVRGLLLDGLLCLWLLVWRIAASRLLLRLLVRP
jgi:hypothetical protein